MRSWQCTWVSPITLLTGKKPFGWSRKPRQTLLQQSLQSRNSQQTWSTPPHLPNFLPYLFSYTVTSSTPTQKAWKLDHQAGFGATEEGMNPRHCSLIRGNAESSWGGCYWRNRCQVPRWGYAYYWEGDAEDLDGYNEPDELDKPPVLTKPREVLAICAQMERLCLKYALSNVLAIDLQTQLWKLQGHICHLDDQSWVQSSLDQFWLKNPRNKDSYMSSVGWHLFFYITCSNYIKKLFICTQKLLKNIGRLWGIISI